MKTVRELLVSICVSEGNSSDESDEFLFEIVSESTQVQESDRDEHRWYFVIWSVVKITFEGVDYFIEYEYYDPKGEDASAEDCGFEIDIDSMGFVTPQEVTKIIYK